MRDGKRAALGRSGSLEQRISELPDELGRPRADAEDRAANLKDELARALAALSAERQKTVEQAELFADLEERQRIAELSHAAAEEEARQLASQCEALGQRVSELSDELGLAVRRRDQEVSALLASLSWKLSAPWRACQRFASRLRLRFRDKAIDPLFDRDWYLAQYPDVKFSGLDPYDHYLRYGTAEGRDPNPYFDSSWYLQSYPDVQRNGMNAFKHYLRYGIFEGRNPGPRFDAPWYLARYPDVRANGMNPFLHFLRYGRAEGRTPHPDLLPKDERVVLPAGGVEPS
jgi:hypothetical protein